MGRLKLVAVPNHDGGRIQRGAAQRAVAKMLVALSFHARDEGLRESPRRTVDTYAELLTPKPFRPTTFFNEEGYEELVLMRSIPFHSLCMHHLLPFHGVARVGNLPDRRVVALSKFARVVELFARALQVQERLTTQIVRWVQEQLEPKGVGVVHETELREAVC